MIQGTTKYPSQTLPCVVIKGLQLVDMAGGVDSAEDEGNFREGQAASQKDLPRVEAGLKSPLLSRLYF